MTIIPAINMLPLEELEKEDLIKEVHNSWERISKKNDDITEVEELLKRAINHIRTGDGDPFELVLDVAEYKRKYE